MIEKQIIVDVKFSRKKDNYSVRLKALHNGIHLIDKDLIRGFSMLQVFEFASAFINKNEATNITVKRGLVEDAFVKFLSNHQKEGAGETISENVKMIEGIPIDSMDSIDSVLYDLAAYKACVEDAARHKDYKGMLMQGILYNEIRKELYDSTGYLANPFHTEVSLPLSEKQKIIDTIVSANEFEISHNIEPYVVKKYNRLVEVSKTDYKLIVSFL